MSKFDEQMKEVIKEQKTTEAAKDASNQQADAVLEIRQLADGTIKWSFPSSVMQAGALLHILNLLYSKILEDKVMPPKKETLKDKLFKPFNK